MLIENNYGFQPRLKNINDEYKSEKRKFVSPNIQKSMKENVPHRIQTDYDC
jgi:hypothetical protein